ncbi:hypothetical protein RHGRI_014314 [Rhododendron griersonianum]|uniref:Uncharacterized protein n=1 Tax=Rhododendron griersonianum TaxID=479676 RepID=A0AAV6K8W6_9ERIC|nr:hypothetical protein RHGRI_014314 [Rhododendron griersonianum]
MNRRWVNQSLPKPEQRVSHHRSGRRLRVSGSTYHPGGGVHIWTAVTHLLSSRSSLSMVNQPSSTHIS